MQIKNLKYTYKNEDKKCFTKNELKKCKGIPVELEIDRKSVV